MKVTTKEYLKIGFKNGDVVVHTLRAASEVQIKNYIRKYMHKEV